MGCELKKKGVEKMKIKDVNRVPKHMTSIGGQALIEGILMRGPKDLAIAVRKPNNEIILKKEKLNTLGMRYKFFRLPLIRGLVGLVESMAFGIRALMYSADFYEDGIEKDGNKETFLDRIFKEKSEEAEIVFTLMISLVFTILLFILLPSLITNFFKRDRKSYPIKLNRRFGSYYAISHICNSSL